MPPRHHAQRVFLACGMRPHPGAITSQTGRPRVDQITCEYWGTTAPARGTSAAIACATLGISGNAVCEDFELTAAVGELIVGNATFKLTG